MKKWKVSYHHARTCFQCKSLYSSETSAAPSWGTFATVDPWRLSAKNPHKVKNLLKGKWVTASNEQVIIDPLNGDNFLYVPSTNKVESKDFVDSAQSCPKSGLHNPIKNPERYLLYGSVTAKAAAKLGQPEVIDYFAKLIQRVAPKSTAQGNTYRRRRHL